MSSIDSRNAARRIYKNIKQSILYHTSTFLGNFVFSLFITFVFRKYGYGEAVDFVFFIAILSIGLWITEAVPPFAVGIFIVIMMLFGFGTDYLIDSSAPVEIYTGTWTSNVIWLLLGGFFLAEAMKVVELDRKLFRLTIAWFGNKSTRLLFGIMFVTALGSMVMSNTATTAMMISSVLPLVIVLGKESPYAKSLLIGIPTAATIGGIGTIIGSTPNAIAVGALQERGISITFMEWMLLGFPTALVLIGLFYLILVRRLKIQDIPIDLSKLTHSNRDIPRSKKISVWITLVLTIALWATEPLHGIPVAGTSAVPILFLTMTQVIQSEQVRSLPWDTLMLVAGGLALGIAIVDVGLAKIIMGSVDKLPIPTVGIVILFSFIAVLLSNVMSNTAASAILMPLAIALPEPYGVMAPLIVAISCSCALLLPVSTPSNAVAYATGMIDQKDFRLGGIFYMVSGPLAAILASFLWVYFYKL